MFGNDNSSNHHFHICWSPSGKIDWDAFTSREDAEGLAQRIKGPHETFEIKEFDQAVQSVKAYWSRPKNECDANSRSLGMVSISLARELFNSL